MSSNNKSKEYSIYKLKLSKDEVPDFLAFRRRHSIVEAKKGKGAKYKRSRDLKASLIDFD